MKEKEMKNGKRFPDTQGVVPGSGAVRKHPRGMSKEIPESRSPGAALTVVNI
jgi:hypothetical protein